jgi:hypothetical protein
MDRIGGGRTPPVGTLVSGLANLAWPAARQLASANAESVQGLLSLEGMERSGIVQSRRVVLELPKNGSPLTPAGWMAVNRLTDYVAKDSRCSEAISLTTLSGDADAPDTLSLLPEEPRKGFLRDDGLATLIEVLPIKIYLNQLIAEALRHTPCLGRDPSEYLSVPVEPDLFFEACVQAFAVANRQLEDALIGG